MRRLLTIASGFMVATAVAVATAPSTSAVPAGSATYTYTGSPQSFTVPAGVTQLVVDAYGASGGDAMASHERANSVIDGPGPPIFTGSDIIGYVGGLGGWARSAVAVTPGEVLQVNVGARGGDAQPDPNDIDPDGGGVLIGAVTLLPGNGGANSGPNGGASGGADSMMIFDGEDTFGCVAAGGGGGGASDVRTGSYSLQDRVVVGAGGGGAGAYAEDFQLLPDRLVFTGGGQGGGQVGGDGVPSSDLDPPAISTGSGGSQGVGGLFGGAFGAGGAGVGEHSGSVVTGPDWPGYDTRQTGGPGGGGGGYYGGGAGYGGGGGSSFANVFTFSGYWQGAEYTPGEGWDGNGEVVISWGSPGDSDPGSPSPDGGGDLLGIIAAVPANPRFTG